MAEPINAFHDLWQLGLVPEPQRAWDTLALVIPPSRLEDFERLSSLVTDHPNLRKFGRDYAFVSLADQAAPANWRTILPQEITATFRRVEARHGIVHLLPDSELRFQEAARLAGAPVRGVYALAIAYATEKIADLTPIVRQLRARLKKEPFAVAFERQLQHLRTTPRLTGLSPVER
ncbi:MAG: hypothetical protein ACRENA_12375 [Vulcanimicrobiaceae bacterium]